MMVGIRRHRPGRPMPLARGSRHLIKAMVVSLGSGLPASLVFQALAEHSLMIRFWATLIAFAVGWYVSRTFVRKYLDL